MEESPKRCKYTMEKRGMKVSRIKIAYVYVNMRETERSVTGSRGSEHG